MKQDPSATGLITRETEVKTKTEDVPKPATKEDVSMQEEK